MEQEDNILENLLREIAGLIYEYPKALERRAMVLQSTGKDPELVEKLLKASHTMRDSGHLYLSWARHYAALATGHSDASTSEDETEDFNV